MPSPGLYRNALGEIAPASHLNFVIANGVVVMPVYGTPTQDAALEALQAVFPDRKVIGVPSRGLLGAGDAGGGSFHCITQRGACVMTKRTITVAAIQSSFGPDMTGQHRQDRRLRARGGKRGAQLVLPPELFQSIYFPDPAGPEMVRDGQACRASILRCARCRSSPRSSNIVIPISFFEKDGPRYYNSVAIADADGEILGVYRKSHIPDGPGYQEKYYFRPGDTGFKAWKTRGRHDRRRHLLGPMVSGSGPRHDAARRRDSALSHAPSARSLTTYRSTPTRAGSARCRGHAVANAVPVVAANRIGVEQNDGATQSYYGHSFIADHTGELVASFGDKEEGVLVAELRSRRDRALPRRMGLLPRPPHRPLRQKHRVIAGADASWLA